MKAARLSRATARLVALAAVPAVLALTSCSSGTDDDPSTVTSAASSSAAPGTTSGTAAATGSPAAQTPVGPGCGDVFAADGPGSLAAVATTPVGTSVSTVPQLSTLAQAVLAANLVDAVNSRQDVTVLAPSNAAFDALGPDALPALLADVPRLTAVLTHHVLPGRLSPAQLVGQHTTLAGDTVTIAGPAEAPTVAAGQTLAGTAPATVVCGGVPTTNATVYVIDQVLQPVG